MLKNNNMSNNESPARNIIGNGTIIKGEIEAEKCWIKRIFTKINTALFFILKMLYNYIVTKQKGGNNFGKQTNT